jgi:hypothetical protein
VVVKCLLLGGNGINCRQLKSKSSRKYLDIKEMVGFGVEDII